MSFGDSYTPVLSHVWKDVKANALAISLGDDIQRAAAVASWQKIDYVTAQLDNYFSNTSWLGSILPTAIDNIVASGVALTDTAGLISGMQYRFANTWNGSNLPIRTTMATNTRTQAHLYARNQTKPSWYYGTQSDWYNTGAYQWAQNYYDMIVGTSYSTLLNNLMSRATGTDMALTKKVRNPFLALNSVYNVYNSDLGRPYIGDTYPLPTTLAAPVSPYVATWASDGSPATYSTTNAFASHEATYGTQGFDSAGHRYFNLLVPASNGNFSGFDPSNSLFESHYKWGSSDVVRYRPISTILFSQSNNLPPTAILPDVTFTPSDLVGHYEMRYYDAADLVWDPDTFQVVPGTTSSRWWGYSRCHPSPDSDFTTTRMSAGSPTNNAVGSTSPPPGALPQAFQEYFFNDVKFGIQYYARCPNGIPSKSFDVTDINAWIADEITTHPELTVAEATQGAYARMETELNAVPYFFVCYKGVSIIAQSIYGRTCGAEFGFAYDYTNNHAYFIGRTSYSDTDAILHVNGSGAVLERFELFGASKRFNEVVDRDGNAYFMPYTADELYLDYNKWLVAKTTGYAHETGASMDVTTDAGVTIEEPYQQGQVYEYTGTVAPPPPPVGPTIDCTFYANPSFCQWGRGKFRTDRRYLFASGNSPLSFTVGETILPTIEQANVPGTSIPWYASGLQIFSPSGIVTVGPSGLQQLSPHQSEVKAWFL